MREVFDLLEFTYQPKSQIISNFLVADRINQLKYATNYL